VRRRGGEEELRRGGVEELRRVVFYSLKHKT